MKIDKVQVEQKLNATSINNILVVGVGLIGGSILKSLNTIKPVISRLEEVCDGRNKDFLYDQMHIQFRSHRYDFDDWNLLR